MGLSRSSEFSDVVNDGYVSAAKTVGTTEVLASAGTSNLTGREILTIYNDSNSIIYYGPTGVSVSGPNKGEPLAKGQSVSIPAGDALNIYLISASASNNVIIQEWA